MSNGKWLSRPEGAAPLFDSEKGRSAAKKRWDTYREEAEKGIIKKANELLDEPVNSMAEAWAKIAEIQYQKALDGNVPSAKFIAEVIDSLPRKESAEIIQDNRQVNVHNFTLSDEQFHDYISDLRKGGENKLANMVEAQVEAGDEAPYKIIVPID